MPNSDKGKTLRVHAQSYLDIRTLYSLTTFFEEKGHRITSMGQLIRLTCSTLEGILLKNNLTKETEDIEECILLLRRCGVIKGQLSNPNTRRGVKNILEELHLQKTDLEVPTPSEESEENKLPSGIEEWIKGNFGE
jgi:hypothetical protein